MLSKIFNSFQPRSLSPAASSHLNLARSLAALAVAGEHVRNLFWVDYGNLNHPNALLNLFYLLTGIGHEAVMVFFVLSGFFISAAVLKFASGEWSIRSYAIDRFSRLYIVLLPALLLGAVCDALTRRLPGGKLYFLQPILHFGPAFATGFTLKALLGNLFFLQGSFVTTFGSNGPLWSLANEFWYYVLWALICLALLGSASQRRPIAAVLLIALCLVFISKSIWVEFPIWLLGAVVHGIPRPALLSNKAISLGAWTLSSAGFGLTLLVAKKGVFPRLEADYLVAVAFTILLYLAIHSSSRVGRRYSQTAKFFAGFSFSLYVIHFPILVLLRTLTWRYPSSQPSSSAACALLAILLTLLLAGYAFSLGTEVFTARFRALLQRPFDSKPNRLTDALPLAAATKDGGPFVPA